MLRLSFPFRRSITRFPPNAAVVNTVDYFRTFHNDPFTFGKLAAVHALSDVHAMGATATGALALATVELAEERVTEEMLVQMLRGAKVVLDEDGCALSGGHTTEGKEVRKTRVLEIRCGREERSDETLRILRLLSEERSDGTA